MSRKLGRIKDQLDFPNLIVETEKKEKKPPEARRSKRTGDQSGDFGEFNVDSGWIQASHR